MKKILTVFCVLFMLGHVPTSAEKNRLSLHCEKIDITPALPKGSKAPVRMPEISIDGTTLFFQSSHPEYIINIVQEGEVVFTSVVPADTTQYELPDYISGECVIEFMTGSYCFWGEIEL